MLGLKFPIALGTDAAGVVVALGSKVNKFAVGDRVYVKLFLSTAAPLIKDPSRFFQGRYDVADTASFQQYAVVPFDIASKVRLIL